MKKRWRWMVFAVITLALGAFSAASVLSRHSPASGAPLVQIAAVAGEQRADADRFVSAVDDEDEEGVSGLKPAITPEQAKAAALAARPGTVTEVELEKEGNVLQFSVDIIGADGTRYDVDVDANTGKVLKAAVEDDESEEDDDEDERATAPAGASITPDQAKSAALAVQPGTVKEAELETEEGRTIYEVEIAATDNKTYEVTVDAVTGKVLESEEDD